MMMLAVVSTREKQQCKIPSLRTVDKPDVVVSLCVLCSVLNSN